MTDNIFVWAAAVFAVVSAALLAPDIFPRCSVCGRRKPRFRFAFVAGVKKAAACLLCSRHYGISTAADLDMFKAAKLRALNKMLR